MGHRFPLPDVPWLFGYVLRFSTEAISTNDTYAATGIAYIHQVSQRMNLIWLASAVNKFGIPHHALSVAVNILLTLMIVIRLLSHGRKTRKAMGASAPAGGWYKTVITILVESCALFAVSFLLFVGFWAAVNPLASVFFSVLVGTQVRSIFAFRDILRELGMSLTKPGKKNRSSLRSLSLYESPMRARHRPETPSLGPLARSALAAKESRRLAMGSTLVGNLRVRWENPTASTASESS